MIGLFSFTLFEISFICIFAETRKVPERENDAFMGHINSVMVEIEERIKQTPSMYRAW